MLPVVLFATEDMRVCHVSKYEPTEIESHDSELAKHWENILGRTLRGFFERFFDGVDNSFNPNATITHRPFPHRKGNWCAYDGIADITVPGASFNPSISFSLRLKWGNLKDTFSRIRPDRTLSRALAEEDIVSRFRERLKRHGGVLSRYTARGTIVPLPHGTVVGTKDGEEFRFPPIRDWKEVYRLDDGKADDEGQVTIKLRNGDRFRAPPRQRWSYVLGVNTYTHGVEDGEDYLNREATKKRKHFIDSDDEDLRGTSEILKIIQVPYQAAVPEEIAEIHALNQRFIMGRVASLVLNHPALSIGERDGFCNDVRAALEAEDINSLQLCDAHGDLKPANLLRDKRGRKEPTDPQTAPEFTGYAHPGLDIGYYFAHEYLLYARTGNPLFKTRSFRWLDICECERGIKNAHERAARWGVPLACFAIFSQQFAGQFGLPKEKPLFLDLWRMIREGTCKKSLLAVVDKL